MFLRDKNIGNCVQVGFLFKVFMHLLTIGNFIKLNALELNVQRFKKLLCFVAVGAVRLAENDDLIVGDQLFYDLADVIRCRRFLFKAEMTSVAGTLHRAV